MRSASLGRGGERLWAVGITAIVVLLRLWFALRVNFCGTPDSCFYLGVAQGLERHHAFRVSFVYDLLLPHLAVPNTGIEYWRPGTSFFLLLLHPFGGVTLHGSALVAILAGVVWAAAAWPIALRATGSRSVALASYALALLLPPAWTGSLTPDSTMFYGAAVAWCLALFSAPRAGVLQDGLALVCVAVAALVRNDAALLIVPLAVVLWRRRRHADVQGVAIHGAMLNSAAPYGASCAYSAAMLFGFLLALAPMHVLYAHVLGTAFPPGTAQAFFLTDLSDFTKYDAPVNPATLLAHGVGFLLTLRVRTMALILYRIFALMLGYAGLVFLPGLLPSVRKYQGEEAGTAETSTLPDSAGPLAFALTLFLVYGLLLPAIGVFSALRSAAGLLPWAAVLVVLGIRQVARDRRTAVVLLATVLLTYLVSGITEDRRDVEMLNATGATDRALAAGLRELGASPGSSAVVMAADPVQFSVTTGYATIAMPGNGLDAMAAEARALRATHAILDTEHLLADETVTRRTLGAVRYISLPAQHALLLQLGARSLDNGGRSSR